MDNTIYTDGHRITVTNTGFYAGNASYNIDGIVSARMLLIKAAITPVILLILIGIAVMATGFLHVYSNVRMDAFYFANILITANRLAIIVGFLLLLFGIIMNIMLRDKYAVHIVTAEGEKDPVISKKKEYVYQIVKALHKALSLK